MEYNDENWGTAGWLAAHDFGGSPDEIVRCQRTTKPYKTAKACIEPEPVVNTKVRRHLSKLFKRKTDRRTYFGAFIHGSDAPEALVFDELTLVMTRFDLADYKAYVSSFAFDWAARYWQALVVFFKKEAK